MIKKLKIFGARILVELVENKQTTSPFLLPDSNKDAPKVGKIILVGDGKIADGKIVEMNLFIDDMVCFLQWAGQKIEIDNKIFYLIKFDDLIGKIG